jgi:hypothetical protein
MLLREKRCAAHNRRLPETLRRVPGTSLVAASPPPCRARSWGEIAPPLTVIVVHWEHCCSYPVSVFRCQIRLKRLFQSIHGCLEGFFWAVGLQMFLPTGHLATHIRPSPILFARWVYLYPFIKGTYQPHQRPFVIYLAADHTRSLRDFFAGWGLLLAHPSLLNAKDRRPRQIRQSHLGHDFLSGGASPQPHPYLRQTQAAHGFVWPF